MADEKVIISIELEDGSIQKGFIKAERQAAESGKKSGDNYEKGFSGSVGNLFSGLTGKFLALGSAIAGAFTFKEALAAAQGQEDAINALNISLGNTGIFSKEASSSMIAFAENMQTMTGIADDAALNVAAVIQNIAKLGSTEDLQKTTQAAADLSAALGKDFESTGEILARAATGNTEALKKMGVSFQKGATDAETFRNIISSIEEQFGGTAASKLQTFSGAILGVSNAFGDFLESIGFLITKSPVVVALVNLLNKSITQLGTGLLSIGQSGDILGDFIKMVIEAGFAINDYLIKPIELLYNVGRIVFNGIVAFLNMAIEGLGALGGALAKVLNAVGIDNNLTETLKVIDESTSEVADGSMKDLKSSIDNLFEGNISQKADEFLETLRYTAETAAPLGAEIKNSTMLPSEEISANNDMISLSFSKLGAAIQDQASKMVITNAQVAKSFLQTFGVGVTRAFSSFGAAIQKGENGFDAFANSIKGIIGDLATQLGQSFILQGIAMLIAGSPGGGALIAAGAALAAFGGYLSSQNAGAGSVGAGGSGVLGAGGQVNPSDDLLFGDETQERRADTAIAVNIQGDVLDSDQSGLRIVNLLNDAFDKQGAVVTRGAV